MTHKDTMESSIAYELHSNNTNYNNNNSTTINRFMYGCVSRFIWNIKHMSALTLALTLFGLAALIIIGVIVWIINAKI